MAPRADTPRPAYNSKNPLGRRIITFAASANPNPVSPAPLSRTTCCCIVLIVSNGARSVLAQAAARPDAIKFLIPFITAGGNCVLLFSIADVDVDVDVDDVEDDDDTAAADAEEEEDAVDAMEEEDDDPPRNNKSVRTIPPTPRRDDDDDEEAGVWRMNSFVSPTTTLLPKYVRRRLSRPNFSREVDDDGRLAA